MSDDIGKGTRVRITGGQGTGQSGAVFWEGPNKFGPGKRFGVRGDNGETYWVDDENVEIDDSAPAAAPPVEAEEAKFEKGDAVRVVSGESEGASGEVFWIGESKFRPGMPRYGVRDESGETHWVDQIEVEGDV
ncbi:MAG: hypothetical protein AAGE52_17920 [Myxococcota bacterium]